MQFIYVISMPKSLDGKRKSTTYKKLVFYFNKPAPISELRSIKYLDESK
jgi:hypothetical protein